ncbi:MAG TPA: lysoplasmalogenase [Permianibacter sp.]|nr:lysoplasmalogenase [Permianibacter sp.]
MWWLWTAAMLSLPTMFAGQYSRQRWYPLLKPLPLLLLISAVVQAPEFTGKTAVLLALAGGWLGDVALLFRRGFLPGLLAFLLGHLAMAVALWQHGAGLNPWLIGLVLLVALLMQRALRPPGRVLNLAVLVYGAVLGVVAVLAIPLSFQQAGAWPLALAAGLFVLSDSLLGWNKFRRPLPTAQLWILGSYFAAQCLFVYSFLTVMA